VSDAPVNAGIDAGHFRTPGRLAGSATVLNLLPVFPPHRNDLIIVVIFDNFQNRLGTCRYTGFIGTGGTLIGIHYDKELT